ncbi:MAG: pyridoxamine 5'-phosphate oxidase family protein [Spirochaetaceae bacterium]|jgi:uncharacterized pyridoxamine 5'-phosphate oxidase family protein|nr:pyridoxamine 5'-phosphate oxidase family protein [Spirochaetaceae bacterium]
MYTFQDVASFLAGKTFYLATVDGDKPKVRPFGFVMEFEGKLYFTTNDQKPSFKQLAANPHLEISATDEKTRTWIRISGKAVFDSRPEVKAKAFEAAPFLKDKYGTGSGPAIRLFYIAGAEAVVQSLTSQDIHLVRF